MKGETRSIKVRSLIGVVGFKRVGGGGGDAKIMNMCRYEIDLRGSIKENGRGRGGHQPSI